VGQPTVAASPSIASDPETADESTANASRM